MAIDQENGMRVGEMATALGAKPGVVYQFVRRHDIPRERSQSVRGVIVDVPAYIDKLRALGYANDANTLQNHLEQRRHGGTDDTTPL